MSIAIDKANELVLCVAADAVRNLMDGKTWFPCPGGGLNLLMDRLGSAWFIARGKCEDDPSFKQIIPYVVLTHDGKVFSYTRGEAGSEGRLHSLFSIGVGGHINQVDRHDSEYPAKAIRRAAERELEEEVGLHWRGNVRSTRVAGLISDDSDAVGKVHMGVCFHVDLYESSIAPAEDALRDGRWLTVEQLKADRASYESWSQFVITHLIGGAQ